MRSMSIVQVIEMTKVESAERVVALGFEVAEAESINLRCAVTFVH